MELKIARAHEHINCAREDVLESNDRVIIFSTNVESISSDFPILQNEVLDLIKRV